MLTTAAVKRFYQALGDLMREAARSGSTPIPWAASVRVLSAGLGAIVRRALAPTNRKCPRITVLCRAACGIIGGLADRFELSSSLRLVAVCPCTVLVPVPHFPNGTLDMAHGRIHLRAARLTFAVLVVTVISAGLLLGLALLGTSLPVWIPQEDPPPFGRTW